MTKLKGDVTEVSGFVERILVKF